MGNHIRILLINILFLLTLSEAIGQGRSDNFWIFGGNGQGLQFGLGDDSLTDNTITTQPLGSGGSAVAADPNTGDIYFYTDGNQIFDRQGNPITVPGGLNGDGTGNQPVVIVPNPNDDPTDGTREYFMYVNVGGELYQHTVSVDVSVGSYPTVTVSAANGPLGSALGTSEAMTVVPSGDGSTYYVVTQQAGTGDFYLIDVATDPAIANSVSPGIPGGAFTAANMEYGPNGQLAVAFNGGVHILESDGAGGLTYVETVGTGQDVFDVAWSPDGTKLYYSTGVGGNVFQYDFTEGSFAAVPGVGGTANFGLQTGPEGSVYHLFQAADGTFQLGEISMADSAAALTMYEDGLFDGADFGGTSFSQVALAQSSFGFNVAPAQGCVGSPIQLVPEFPPGTPEPDSIVWVLPSGPVTAFSPTFTPEDAGATATAFAFWDTLAIPAQVPLTVTEFDLQIPIVQDTTICPGDSIALNAEPESGGGGQGGGGGQPGGGGAGGSYTYLWSTGETEAEIMVGEAGVYWVLVSDGSGCTAYAESNVKEYQVQNQSYNVWYFGNGAGIDFNNLYDNPNNPDDNGDGEDNDGEVVPLGDGAQNAPEGVEAISDANGDALFYTDGRTLYFVSGGNHTEVPDALGAPVDLTEGAAPGAAATMVGMVQVPGSDASYYIFTTTPVESGGYELRYAVVNLNGFNTSTNQPGPVIISSNNVLFSLSTERVTIQGGRGGSATLLAHEYGNNAFRAYLITEQGIGTPVISSVGTNHDLTSPEDAQGYMKIGGDSTGTIVGVVAEDRIEIFNLDQSTLELSEPTVVDFSSVGAQPYGLEFQSDSVGNTVVIVSTDNGIYVASVERPLEEGTTINIQPVGGATGVFGAIQQGPDGQVYVAQDGATGLGTVSGNVNDPSSYTYQPDQVQLPAGATVTRGLPSYVDQGGNSFPEPDIMVEDACVGNETMFSAQGRDDVIETYRWSIVRLNEDGTTTNYGLPDSLATEQSFSFAIDTLGDFEARVVLNNPCDDSLVLVQQFTMGTAPEVTLPESVNLCNGGVELTAIDSGDVSGLTFQWILQGAVGGGNFPPTNTITATEPGLYNVTVINADSCTSEGQVFVVDNRPPVELPEDFTLCQNEEREIDVEIASPGDPGYEWIILEGGVEVNRSEEPLIEISTLTPDAGVYEYTVTVTDDVGCFVQDTVVITILEAPEIEGTVTDSECGEDVGEIQVNILSDPNEVYTFEWTDRDGNIVGTTGDIANLGAGVYTVTVNNSIGCSTTQQFAISDADADFDVVTAPRTGCDDTGVISVELTPVDPPTFGGVNWTIFDGDGSELISGINSSDLNFILPETNPSAGNGLAPGSYAVEFVSIPGGCIQADTLTIPEPDSVDFDLPGLRVFCEPSEIAALDPNTGEPLRADNNTYGFVWTNVTPGVSGSVGIEAGTRTQNPVTIREAGTYEVQVTELVPADPDNPLCPSTQQVEVSFETPPTIQAIVELEDNSCEEGEKTIGVEFAEEVADTDNLIYEWQVELPDGTVQTNIGATQNITITRTGSYSVNVRRRGGGSSSCTIASSPQPFVVNQPLSVLILFGSACDDGTDIPLIARVTTDGTDSLSYEWYDEAGTRLPASGDTLLLRPDMPEGEYRVVVAQQTANGCTAEAAASVTRDPVPESNLGNGPFVICPDDPDPEANSVQLEVSFAPSIRWTTPFGEFLNTETLPATQGGTYVVEVTNEFGCSTIDSVEVIEDCRPTIVAPNAFRPNGVNSEFFVYPRYVANDDFEVRIYNRWGELVFQSNSKDFRWDGTYNGRPAPLGSYPYVITFKSDTDNTGEILEERGGVTIIR